MVIFDTIYKYDLISASLISSSYDTSYHANDYNSLPAISFPMKSGYRYKAGKFDHFIDTNFILIEAMGTEFELFKFGEFKNDVTLTFQFHERSLDFLSVLSKPKKTVEAFHRSPHTDCLLKSFLANHLKGERLFLLAP